MGVAAQKVSRPFGYEVLLYFSVYVLYLLYGVWKLYGVRDEILLEVEYELSPGWSWIGRPRDDSNDELHYFSEYVQDMWPWYLLQLAVSIIVGCKWPQRRSTGHALVAITALAYSMSPIFLALIGGLLFSYLLAAHTGSKRLTWCLSALWMLLITLIKMNTDWAMVLGYKGYYILLVTMSWSLLRGCSFALTRINDSIAGVETLCSAEHFLGYSLYLPTLIHGPLISFRRYAVPLKQQQRRHQQEQQQHKRLGARCLTLVWELARVFFWWFVVHFAQHFIYLDYMKRDASVLRLLQPTFSHHAVGYFMGQFFFLFYVVTYGMGIAFARFDGMEPPRRPRCIGRIHFYSDMWKYFDEGLYEFLFHHIYAELCSKRSSIYAKICATAITFAFVFLWHGCYIYVLIWSVLSFSCLVAEKCFKTFTASRLYAEWVDKYLDSKAGQRLYALLATQIFIPAAFANVYFIGGEEMGYFLMRSAYMSGAANYIALTFCSYCFFQCSEVISNLK